MGTWKTTLDNLIKDQDKHARFLNTISLMEYMGARKIVKSQNEKDVDSEVLAHMTEEIRHAQIFKKMALKLSEGKLKTYSDDHLLAGQEGRAYIQTVDRSVANALEEEDSHYNYLLSTLIIEERANSVYPYYSELLEPFGFGGHLRAILREEEGHLQQIEESLKQHDKMSDEKLDELRKIETKAFDNLINAISMSL